MQDINQLATIVAKRKGITLKEATDTINSLVAGKTIFGAKLAIADYLESKKSSTTLPGLEDIDPINHIKE
jgi:hypothetical protein